jgi:hypothetical protein
MQRGENAYVRAQLHASERVLRAIGACEFVRTHIQQRKESATEKLNEYAATRQRPSETWQSLLLDAQYV